MQNKHQFFLVLGVPNFDEGGGANWVGQNPNIFEKFDLKASLSSIVTRDKFSVTILVSSSDEVRTTFFGEGEE